MNKKNFIHKYFFVFLSLFWIALIIHGSNNDAKAIYDLYQKNTESLWATFLKVPQNKQYNFELSNKSGQPLYIELKQKTIYGIKSIIPSDVEVSSATNSNKIQGRFLYHDKPLYLKIWRGNNQGTPNMYVKIDPCIKKENYCNKTVYLTLDNNGLREQKGTLGGLSGRTESGLSLRNNIKLIGGGPDQNIWNLPVF